TQSRNIDGILKKGGASIFASLQYAELTSSIHVEAKEPCPIKKLIKASEIEYRNLAKPEDHDQTEEGEL
ncbi:hypothetical protein L873DRAFT_1824635, partial [Choiromyces venosus 120613-1]